MAPPFFVSDPERSDGCAVGRVPTQNTGGEAPAPRANASATNGKSSNIRKFGILPYLLCNMPYDRIIPVYTLTLTQEPSHHGLPQQDEPGRLPVQFHPPRFPDPQAQFAGHGDEGWYPPLRAGFPAMRRSMAIGR